eukprot:876185-Pleurochrysis_carterae.AAC.1
MRALRDSHPQMHLYPDGFSCIDMGSSALCFAEPSASHERVGTEGRLGYSSHAPFTRKLKQERAGAELAQESTR